MGLKQVVVVGIPMGVIWAVAWFGGQRWGWWGDIPHETMAAAGVVQALVMLMVLVMLGSRQEPLPPTR